jgi:hypothetical protein
MTNKLPLTLNPLPLSDVLPNAHADGCLSLTPLWACAFRAGVDASIFFSGVVEAEGGTRVLSRRNSSSGISWRILFFVKTTQHRHGGR